MSAHPLLPPLPSGSSSKTSKLPFFIPSVAEPHVFHPHDTGAIVLRTTGIGAGVGLAVSSVQNALQKHEKGAMGIFTRTGGSIAYFTAIAFAYSGAQSVAANVRESDDAVNAAIGGCAAGFVAGIYGRSLPRAVGSCAFMGTVMGTFYAAGGKLEGTDSTSGIEREEAKKAWFKPKQPVSFNDASAS